MSVLGRRVRLIAALAAGVIGLASGPVPGAPASGSGGRLEITADDMTVQAATRTVRAAGRVRITDGRITATADRATLYHREGRGVLGGRAQVKTPQGELEGQEITIAYTAQAITRIVAHGSASLDTEGTLTSAPMIAITPSADRLVAERGVSVFARPDIIATGERLTYERAPGRILLEGAARVQTRDGFLGADRIEAFRRWDRVVATNNVHGRFRDIEVRSKTAELLSGEQKAVFTGEVRLMQPGRHLVTERVTVWYAAGRIVAEGQTTVRLEPQP